MRQAQPTWRRVAAKDDAIAESLPALEDPGQVAESLSHPRNEDPHDRGVHRMVRVEDSPHDLLGLHPATSPFEQVGEAGEASRAELDASMVEHQVSLRPIQDYRELELCVVPQNAPD